MSTATEDTYCTRCGQDVNVGATPPAQTFAVGDLVRFRDDFDDPDDSWGATSLSLLGKTGRVTRVVVEADGTVFLDTDIPGGDGYTYVGRFEKVESADGASFKIGDWVRVLDKEVGGVKTATSEAGRIGQVTRVGRSLLTGNAVLDTTVTSPGRFAGRFEKLEVFDTRNPTAPEVMFGDWVTILEAESYGVQDAELPLTAQVVFSVGRLFHVHDPKKSENENREVVARLWMRAEAPKPKAKFKVGDLVTVTPSGRGMIVPGDKLEIVKAKLHEGGDAPEWHYEFKIVEAASRSLHPGTMLDRFESRLEAWDEKKAAARKAEAALGPARLIKDEFGYHYLKNADGMWVELELTGEGPFRPEEIANMKHEALL